MQNTQQTSSFWMYVFFIIFLGFLGLVGYGAYSLLSNPAHYAEEIWEKQRVAKTTNTETSNSIINPVVTSEKEVVQKNPDAQKKETIPEAEKSLSEKINSIISRNVILKQGDKGADVAVIQQFMNQHYKRNDKIDSDFGPGLVVLVKKFQTSQKLPGTGQVASRTLGAMKNLAK